MFLDIVLNVNPSSSHPNFWICYNHKYNIKNYIHFLLPVDSSQILELMAFAAQLASSHILPRHPKFESAPKYAFLLGELSKTYILMCPVPYVNTEFFWGGPRSKSSRIPTDSEEVGIQQNCCTYPHVNIWSRPLVSTKNSYGIGPI